MKSSSCLLMKQFQPYFCAYKFSSMAAPPSTTHLPSSNLSVASTVLSQQLTRAGKRSSKAASTASLVVPFPPEPTTTTVETPGRPVSPKKELGTTNEAKGKVRVCVGKQVLVPIGYGTEEMEAVILVDVLRRAGAEVTVASVESKLEVEASGGTRLIADTSISTCSDQVFDLIALPGGMPGAARLRDCEILKKITSKQAEEKRLYGAICAAPAITLLPWGLLKRKRTTCHPAFKDMLPNFWAVSSSIQVSGELTTSRGPGTCFAFAVCLVEQLFGESAARAIGELLLLNSVEFVSRLEEFNKVDWSVDRTPLVLVPVANGSEVIELVTIIDILRRAKVEVVVASVGKSIKVSASHGIRIVADKFIGEAAQSTYDAIILPGGVAGTERLQKSRILTKLLKGQDMAGRIYGAVSSSVTVLHRHGLLTEKRVATDPSSASKLGSGITADGAKVVVDGKLITSRGLAATADLALAIVSKLFGHSRARSVAEGLVFEFPRS